MNAPLPESIRKALESVTLDDKYTLDHGRAFMSGVQALVRLPMLQRQRDARRGPEHRRLHQRLPRLAAGRLRPGAVGGQEAPGGAAHRVPARRQRGTRRHRGVGHAAARPLPAEQEVRRRVRHLVRQGPGRGPLLRRVQARQHGRHREARRRDRASPATTTSPRAAPPRTRATTSSRPAGCRCSSRRSVQDILDLGLHAFAMSRFAGVWAGMKTIQEVVESSASRRASTPTA